MFRGENDEQKELCLEEMMGSYQTGIYLLAYSFVKDRGLAEDITQEVFIKCYRYLDTFRKESSLKTWVYTIAVNLCKDYLRKWEYRIRKLPFQYVEELPAVEDVEEQTEKSEEQRELQQVILDLPVRYREVIFLYYFEDIKINEISVMLGLKENTVKTRLARGRNLLKKKLGAYRG